MTKIVRTTSDNADFQELVELLDQELDARYGLVQKQYKPYNKIVSLDTVVVAYQEGDAAGSGCFKAFDANSVEIKRMIVKPNLRGTGLAEKILLELERWAVERGYAKTILETGIKQPEAIRFYTKLGYKTIENYGQYIGNSNSICMAKELK